MKRPTLSAWWQGYWVGVIVGIAGMALGRLW